MSRCNNPFLIVQEMLAFFIRFETFEVIACNKLSPGDQSHKNGLVYRYSEQLCYSSRHSPVTEADTVFITLKKKVFLQDIVDRRIDET
jgi:hypothetical protein